MALNKKIRVVHLIDFLGPGGAQELVRLVIKKSSPDFLHEVIALTSLKPYYENSIREAGADVRYLSRHWKWGLAGSMPLLAANFRGILQKSSPDILHLHMPGSMVVGCVGSAGHKVRRVLGIYAWKRAFSPWVYPGIRALLPLLDKVAWVDKAEIPWVPDKKFIKIFPGVETPLDFSSGTEKIRQEFSLQGKGPFLFSIARIHPHKGHAAAIRVFTEVRRHYPQAVLFVIGEGEARETEKLHRLAEDAGKDGIFFTGYRTDLNFFLGLGGFFLRPSENESGNMTTILSAFAGVVAVGYSMKNVLPSDIEMIRHDQTGKIVPLGDHQKMAAEVVGLWKNREEFCRLSGEAVRYAGAHWDIQKTMLDPIEAGYRQLVREFK